jgi:MFS family permease
MTTSVLQLVGVRLLQGFAGSAAAVFAPGMLRKMFNLSTALRALGLMGSIESMVPALAPILGAWMLIYYDWQLSFVIIGALSAVLAVVWLFFPSLLPSVRSTQSNQGYGALLKNRRFQNYALSQAFTLGGLLMFVFGAPTVVALSMGGSLIDFVVMQVIGIAFYVVSVNLAGHSVARFGACACFLLLRHKAGPFMTRTVLSERCFTSCA